MIEEYNIEDRILGILQDEYQISIVDTNKDLRQELDSLEILELGIIVEEKFGVHVRDSDLADMHTVQSIVRFIEDKRG